MKASEIRQRFLGYFGRHAHEIVPSSSLIPHNDPTLFFVNAGMVQFKDVFTGAEHRAVPRATTVQKCLRVSGKHNDLENVGRTPRHHTFFEMLGNFSFGDYFKDDAIPMAWELLTGDLGIDPDRLWVTVFEEDDEAEELWKSIPKVVHSRAHGSSDWAPRTTSGPWATPGPCGPCSEIFYDHGPAITSVERRSGHRERPLRRDLEPRVHAVRAARPSGHHARQLPRPSASTRAPAWSAWPPSLQGVYFNYDTDLLPGPAHRHRVEEAGCPATGPTTARTASPTWPCVSSPTTPGRHGLRSSPTG